MPILNQGLIKLQEHLLNKSPQNATSGLKLSRCIIVAKHIYKSSKIECINDLVDWVTDQQLIIGGYSRLQFLDSIKSMPQPVVENDKKGDKK